MRKDHFSKDSITHHLRPGSFGRFFIIGGFNTFIGLGCFPCLYLIAHRILTVNQLIVISWTFCTTVAFILHKFVTFQSDGHAHHEGMKFLILSLIILGINLTVMNLMIHFTSLHPILVQFTTTVVLTGGLMILNYLGMSRFIFKKSGKSATPEA